jgi:hypothetical protein
MKPIVSNFLIGPGRSGTSLLYQAIRNAAPERVPRIKETQFFDRNFHRGYEWYHAKYSGAARSGCWDFSNRYYLHPSVAERVASYNSDARIFFVFRDRADVFRSMLYFERRKGLSHSEIEKIAPRKFWECDFDRHLAPFRAVFREVTAIEFSRITDAEYISDVLNELVQKEDLESKVNETKVPRSRFLGHAAKTAARCLRAANCDVTLDWLKRSQLAKAVILKPYSPDPIIEELISTYL